MKGRRNMVKRWSLWAAVALISAAAAAAPVRDIRVVPAGPVPVSAEQVLAQISARVGQELDRGALSDDIRALQKSGAYSYAEVRLDRAADDGVILVFLVKGKPRIRTLTVTGADYIGNKKVKNLMEIGSGDRADEATLGQKSQKVRDHYRKEYFPDAKLAWTFRPAAEDPDLADVDITVTEGKRAVVRKIRFVGNKHVSARELRKVMTQKQANWLSWITSDGMYDPGILMSDRELVRKVFMDKGYLGAVVGEPVIAYVSRKKIDITFQVTEGPVYKMGVWRLGGLSLFPTNDVARGVSVYVDWPEMYDDRTNAPGGPDAITFVTTSSHPHLEIRLLNGSATNVLWHWGDGRIDRGTWTADRDFGSPAVRTNYVEVQPPSAVTFFGANQSYSGQGIRAVYNASNFPALNYLYLYQQGLEELSLAGCSALVQLHLAGNPVSTAVCDQWFLDLDAAVTGAVQNADFYFPASAPSAASAPARSNLAAKGYTLHPL